MKTVAFPAPDEQPESLFLWRCIGVDLPPCSRDRCDGARPGRQDDAHQPRWITSWARQARFTIRPAGAIAVGGRSKTATKSQSPSPFRSVQKAQVILPYAPDSVYHDTDNPLFETVENGICCVKGRAIYGHLQGRKPLEKKLQRRLHAGRLVG